MNKSFLKFFGLAILLILAGCGPTSDGAPLSKAGLRPEMFFSQDTIAVVSVDYRNEETKKKVTDLLALFPDYEGETLVDAMKSAFFKALSEEGYNFDADIKPIVGEGTRFVLGIEGGQALKDFVEPVAVNTLPVYIGFEIADVQKFDQFLADLESRGEVKPLEYSGRVVYEGADKDSGIKDGCIARVEDIGLLTNSCDVLQTAIERGLKDKDNLDRKESYRRVVKEMEGDYFGFFYFEGGRLISLLKEKAFETASLERLFGVSGTSLAEAVVAQGVTLTPEEGGFALRGYQYADETKLLGRTYKDFYTTGELFASLPADDAIFFAESSNLRLMFEDYLKQLDALNSLPEGQVSPRQSLENALRVVGLDIEEDILSWMDKGFVFSAYSNGDLVLPGLILLIDASSDLDAAVRTAGILDAQLQSVLTMLRVQGGEQLADAIKHQSDGTMYTISLDFSGVDGETTGIPGLSEGSPLASQKIELTYGVTTDGKFVISTLGDFSAKYGESFLRNDENFKKLKGNLDVAETVLGYLDLQNVVAYLDTLNQFYTEEERVMLDKFKSLLEPLQGGVFAVTPAESEVWMEGFVGVE